MQVCPEQRAQLLWSLLEQWKCSVWKNVNQKIQCDNQIESILGRIMNSKSKIKIQASYYRETIDICYICVNTLKTVTKCPTKGQKHDLLKSIYIAWCISKYNQEQEEIYPESTCNQQLQPLKGNIGSTSKTIFIDSVFNFYQ